MIRRTEVAMEFTHVRSRDTRAMTLALVMAKMPGAALLETILGEILPQVHEKAVGALHTCTAQAKLMETNGQTSPTRGHYTTSAVVRIAPQSGDEKGL